MNIIALPEMLSPGKIGPVHVYAYHSDGIPVRHKINLTRHTFSFLQKGTKELVDDHAAETVPNHSFLLMKAGNCLMTETSSDQRTRYESVLMFFAPEALLQFVERHGLQPRKNDSEQSFSVFRYDDYVQDFVQSLKRIADVAEPWKSRMAQAKFEEIMSYLVARNGEHFLAMMMETGDDQMVRFLRVVERHKLKKLTLQELAFLSNMSLSTFKRTFQQHFGMAPGKWFLEKRLAHAAFLLKTDQKRPIELFEDAGYECFTNFVQAFRKQFGVTPKQFQMTQA